MESTMRTSRIMTQLQGLHAAEALLEAGSTADHPLVVPRDPAWLDGFGTRLFTDAAFIDGSLGPIYLQGSAMSFATLRAKAQRYGYHQWPATMHWTMDAS
jgi:hypothetical protein